MCYERRQYKRTWKSIVMKQTPSLILQFGILSSVRISVKLNVQFIFNSVLRECKRMNPEIFHVNSITSTAVTYSKINNFITFYSSVCSLFIHFISCIGDARIAGWLLPLGVQKDKIPHPSSFSREIGNEQGYLIGVLHKVKRRVGTEDKLLYMEAPFYTYIYIFHRGL
jgi:hypothetical protein